MRTFIIITILALFATCVPYAAPQTVIGFDTVGQSIVGEVVSYDTANNPVFSTAPLAYDQQGNSMTAQPISYDAYGYPVYTVPQAGSTTAAANATDTTGQPTLVDAQNNQLYSSTPFSVDASGNFVAGTQIAVDNQGNPVYLAPTATLSAAGATATLEPQAIAANIPTGVDTMLSSIMEIPSNMTTPAMNTSAQYNNSNSVGEFNNSSKQRRARHGRHSKSGPNAADMGSLPGPMPPQFDGTQQQNPTKGSSSGFGESSNPNRRRQGMRGNRLGASAQPTPINFGSASVSQQSQVSTLNSNAQATLVPTSVNA